MKAWQIHRNGSPEQALEIAQRDVPDPVEGEVGVDVEAAAIGLPDLFMCRGSYEFKPRLPFTPGQEVAGVVRDPGPSGRFERGQRVLGVTAFYRGHGGFAEQSVLVEGSTWPIPDGMSDTEAAGFAIPFRTAWLALVARAGLRSGETLLVHGAAGGSGFAAVQLGHALGARVIAVAAGDEKCDLCRENGADTVIDRKQEDFVDAVRSHTSGTGVDVVFDPVGGETFLRSLDCVAPGGRLIPIGFASGSWADAPTARLVRQNVSVVGMVAVATSQAVADEMETGLMELYGKGSIRPCTTRTLPFDALPSALLELDAGSASGKQVLSVP